MNVVWFAPTGGCIKRKQAEGTEKLDTWALRLARSIKPLASNGCPRVSIIFFQEQYEFACERYYKLPPCIVPFLSNIRRSEKIDTGYWFLLNSPLVFRTEQFLCTQLSKLEVSNIGSPLVTRLKSNVLPLKRARHTLLTACCC